MSDFIELNEVFVNNDGFTSSKPRVFNKSLIGEIPEDRAHDQTWINYDGKDIAVTETLLEINSK